jgi:hypothetical protein
LENNYPVLPLCYLPPTSYFAIAVKHGGICLEAHENFTKQTLRNRCYIKTAQGIQMLSVPVIHHGKVPYQELEIDSQTNWSVLHWRAIQAAYGKAPYFQFYAPYFENFYSKSHHNLWAFNRELFLLCLKLVKLSVEITETSDWQKTIFSAPDYRNSLKNSYFPTEILQVVPYYQVFGVDFEKGLSIIDLLFNCGPDSKAILQKMIL